MKVSVSLAANDVAFLDAYARAEGYGSRSAALQQAVRLLRSSQLGAAYAAAWDEWRDSGEGDAWEALSADGLGPGA